MKKIYFTLLAIAAIGASQVVLANDGDSQGNEWAGDTTSSTADETVPTCDEIRISCELTVQTSQVNACIIEEGCEVEEE
jgi:hypothetical protein